MDDPIDIVAEALKCAKVDDLYNVIAARGQVAFELGRDGEPWGSKTVNGATRISATPTKHPAASLYHELLHAQLKLNGYRQYSVWVSIDADKQPWLIPIGEALDNELKHHRMIAEFLNAGFKADEFYHDDDVDAFKHARRSLQGLKRNDITEEFLLPFMTVLAPGGFGSEDERQKLNNMFKANSAPKTWTVLSGIGEELAAWAHHPSLDPGDIIVRVLRVLGGYEHTWIGISKQFPDEGKFVGTPFTLEEVQNWQAQRSKGM
jgi:hypothetical protein